MAGERILVVDQHRHTAELLTSTLEGEGFTVRTACDSGSAVAAARTFSPQIVICNATTGGADGLALVRALQNSANVAMMLLTVRDALYSRDELVARVHALLRRNTAAPGIQSMLDLPVPGQTEGPGPVVLPGLHALMQARREQGPQCVSFGDLELDYGRHDVRVRNLSARLSRTEFAVVAHLITRPGNVIHYDDLLEAIWGPPYRGERHLLQVHVQRLRLKLAAAGAERDYIRNRWGIGYAIEPPEAAEEPSTAPQARSSQIAS
jgi:DNA-binding response OmpR family regulator